MLRAIIAPELLWNWHRNFCGTGTGTSRVAKNEFTVTAPELMWNWYRNKCKTGTGTNAELVPELINTWIKKTTTETIPTNSTLNNDGAETLLHIAHDDIE